MDLTKLSQQEKSRVIKSLIFMVEKCDRTIKSRLCANGSKQKVLLKDFESVYSPTVSFEAQIMTLLIDTIEKRKVATFDIPGAYLHADMPEEKKLLLKL